MFINDINPVILDLGYVQIRWYGLVYAFGLVIYYILIRKLFSKLSKKYKQLDKEDADLLVVVMAVSMIIGSRLFHCFYYCPSYYLKHPLSFFSFWNGGMSFHGAFLFSTLTAYIFSRIKKINFYELADTLILPLPILLFFGRIANSTNSELIGKPFSGPWCVVFKKIDNICRHPVQLYEALKNLIIFISLYITKSYYNTRKKNYVKGTIFWLFVLLYGILRFLFNFLRDNEPKLFVLDKAQWLCLLMIFASSWWFVKLYLSKREHKK